MPQMASNQPVDRRAMRKRGLLRLADQEIAEASAWVDRNTARRLRRINSVAATAFVFGGSLFAIGAGLAQAGAAPTLYCSVYLAGGIFFSAGGYATVLQAVNGPRAIGADGRFLPRDWHWWASEPDRIEWMSSFALFFGTIV